MGSSINDVMHREGRKANDIVTIRDVEGGGKRLRDVTHVTSAAARPGQGIMHDSASILYRTPWYSTHGASEGK